MTKYAELRRRFSKTIKNDSDFALVDEIDSVFSECRLHLEKHDGRIDHEVYLTTCHKRVDFLARWESRGIAGPPPTTGFHDGLVVTDPSRLFRSVIVIDAETLLQDKESFVMNLVMTLMEELVHASGETDEFKTKSKGYEFTESYLERKIPNEYKNRSLDRARK